MLINLISIAFFSAWQPYMNIIMHSARHNPEVRFTLITNLNETHDSWEAVFGDMTKPSNVIFAPYTFEMIIAEINKDNVGLGSTPISIKAPYKLIDFKPMYGKIFHKELIGYTHWGWFDLDIHLGDVKRSYECDYQDEDFISFDNVRVHGPLMVNRNSEFVTTFYKNVMQYPEFLNFLQGSRAILFDEVFLPHLIKKNDTVTLKRSHKRSCEGQDMYMWYKGQMQSTSGSCVIYHFGGGGPGRSARGKARQWERVKEFFDGGYHKNNEYGYGTFSRVKVGEFSFVFKYDEDNVFKIVNATSPQGDGHAKKLSEKYFKPLQMVSRRFQVPNSVCLPFHITAPKDR